MDVDRQIREVIENLIKNFGHEIHGENYNKISDTCIQIGNVIEDNTDREKDDEIEQLNEQIGDLENQIDDMANECNCDCEKCRKAHSTN